MPAMPMKYVRAVELTVAPAVAESEAADTAPSILARVAPFASEVANITLMLRPPAVTPFDSALASSVEFAVTLTAPLDVSEAVEPTVAVVAAVLVSSAFDEAPPPLPRPIVIASLIAVASLSPIVWIVIPDELVTSPSARAIAAPPTTALGIVTVAAMRPPEPVFESAVASLSPVAWISTAPLVVIDEAEPVEAVTFAPATKVTPEPESPTIVALVATALTVMPPAFTTSVSAFARLPPTARIVTPLAPPTSPSACAFTSPPTLALATRTPAEMRPPL